MGFEMGFEFEKLGVEDLIRVFGLSRDAAQQIVERRKQTDRQIEIVAKRINDLKKDEMFVLCYWNGQHGTHPFGVSDSIDSLVRRAEVFDTKPWTNVNPSPLQNVVQSSRLSEENEYLLILRVPEF